MGDIFKSALIQLSFSFLMLGMPLLSSCVSVRHDQPIIMDMYYHDARKQILKSGWAPAKGMPLYGDIGADAHYLRDLGYAEVYDCTGAGISLCTFYFQNEKGEYLRIGTEGEYYDPHFEFQTRVVSAAIRNEID